MPWVSGSNAYVKPALSGTEGAVDEIIRDVGPVEKIPR